MNSGYRGDPTARPRCDHLTALRDAQQIIHQHLAGESVRSISKAVGLSRTSVHRVIQDFRAAQRAEDTDSEMAALLAKYGDDGLRCWGCDQRAADPRC